MKIYYLLKKNQDNQNSPFLPKNVDKKRNGGNKMPKEYYLYVKEQKVKVSEQIYKVY